MTANPLDEIHARAANCRTYNFGMWAADKLAHDDAPKLLAALRAVEDLATAWESRAAHDREYAKNVPAPIREDFLELPATMEHLANLIRAAIREALGG